MNITVTSERPEVDKVHADITVSAVDVDAAIDKTYKDIARQYNFQGFRRGHAPRPVIDSAVGREAVLGDATNNLMNDVQPQVIEELDIVPVERPDYGGDVDPVVEHEDFHVEFTVTVPPLAELKSYDAPAINMPPETATDAEIEQQIENLISYNVTYEDEEGDREIVPGDMVVLDVENVEGAPELDGTDRQFGLKNRYLPQEFKDGLVGLKKGDTKTIEWTKSHEGHEHHFEVKITVKGLKNEVVPELNDEFAKKSFGFDTVDELRNAVKEEIEEDKKTSLPTLKEDRVVEAIGEQLDMDEIPEAYESQVFTELANEVLTQIQRQGLTLDMYLSARQITAQQFTDDLHEQAHERARQSLALDALARKLDFDATDEDVRSEFEKAGVDDVDKSMKEFVSDGRMPAIRESIRRTKAVNWLVENATVTEVDEVAEARAKQDDEDADAEAPAEQDAPAEDASASKDAE